MAAAVAAADAAAAEAAVVAEAEVGDRLGIGWREPLAAGIFEHLNDIDAIEVIAENCVPISGRRIRSLRALGREVPLLVHGVGLGPASVSPVDAGRLAQIARVISALEPCAWSEHLCFVRSGGYEIGHLAAPPRNAATVEGAVANLARLRAAVGMAPAVENTATLMMPPASTLEEPDWVAAIAAAAGVPLLLDLHNLYANAVNFGFDPLCYLRRFPLAGVTLVHISGGDWIPAAAASGRRLLDDHLHDVPDAVFTMLEVLGEHCRSPLTVVLERDGRFPSMTALLGQLRRARLALTAGRDRRRHHVPSPAALVRPQGRARMNSPRLETLLARLLVDAEFREEFLRNPRQITDAQRLDAAEREALFAIDRPGLGMASNSIAAKHARQGADRGFIRRAVAWLG